MTLVEQHDNDGGERWLAVFPSGVQVSVVRHSRSYGNRRGEGLWELGIFAKDQSWENWCGVFPVPYVGGDVRGWLTFEECATIAAAVGKMNIAKLVRFRKASERKGLKQRRVKYWNNARKRIAKALKGTC